jgi:hypothetical protein
MEHEALEHWTRPKLLAEQNQILQQILASRSPEAVEAAMSYARFLRLAGLNSENYPLFLKLLEVENHWVLDSLLGDANPFLMLSTIQPNRYLMRKCFELLTRWQPSGIYPKTLSVVTGALQNAYSSPRDGYRIYALSVADVNNLGKYLNKDEGQNESTNRCLLDILDRISSLEGLHWDDSMETVARQSDRIRGYFFDNSKTLADCMPQVLLVKGNYREGEVLPSMVFVGPDSDAREPVGRSVMTARKEEDDNA